MVYSRDKELMNYAMQMGCKTVAEFAFFLKGRHLVMNLNEC